MTALAILFAAAILDWRLFGVLGELRRLRVAFEDANFEDEEPSPAPETTKTGGEP